MADIGYIERKRYGGDETEVNVYRKRAFGSEASIAVEMLQRWGMVAGIEDGEDSQGRQKVHLLTPEELVTRACETAALAIQEFERRGWAITLPDQK